MKTASEILRETLEADHAGRKLTDHEWEIMPLKNHILKAMTKYASQFISSEWNEHFHGKEKQQSNEAPGH